jgi:hypothetical protein
MELRRGKKGKYRVDGKYLPIALYVTWVTPAGCVGLEQLGR